MNEPRRLTQTFLHNEEDEVPGNCFPTCIAMLLGCEIEEVPHPTWDEVKDWSTYWPRLTTWLEKRGWSIIELDIRGYQEEDFKPVLYVPESAPRLWHMAYGPGGRGNPHSVVMHGIDVWHDPHPEGEGLEEIEVLTFLVPMKPWAQGITTEGEDDG